MKSIKKITSKVSDNVSALAGSALLVGATLTGGAAFAAAQSGSSGNSMSLGDYPQPFVTEDGQVDTSIVLGSDAKVTDVVGAVEVAGSLGMNAFQTTTKTATGQSSYGWSVSNGALLSDSNDNLYFSDLITAVTDELDSQDLPSVLSETTFEDASGNDVDVEQTLKVGNQQIQYKKTGTDSDVDPALNVNLPSNVNADNYLYELRADFSRTTNFDAMADEEVSMFGKSFTVADDKTDDNTLVLYGSQVEKTVESGQSTTFTVGGEEYTVSLTGVTSGTPQEAVFTVGNKQYTKEKGDTVSLGDSELRVKSLLSFDNMNDRVTFAVGSQELKLEDGQQVENTDGDVEGTYVDFKSSNSSAPVTELDEIHIAVGPESDDNEAVKAGETFTHSLFSNLEFHFAGLNPNAAESDSVSQVKVSSSSDDTAKVSFTSEGEDVTMPFAHYDSGSFTLSAADNEDIVVKEGNTVTEDDYFTTNANEERAIYQVTNVDVEEGTAGEISSDDTATVELENAVTGDTMSVELDGSSSNGDYRGEANDHYFKVSPSGDVTITWGENEAAPGVPGQVVTAYSAVNTPSGALSFTQNVSVNAASATGSQTYSPDFQLTEDADQITVSPTDSMGDISQITVHHNGSKATSGTTVIQDDQTGDVDGGSTGEISFDRTSLDGGSAKVNVSQIEVTAESSGTAAVKVTNSGSDSIPRSDLADISVSGSDSAILELPANEVDSSYTLNAANQGLVSNNDAIDVKPEDSQTVYTIWQTGTDQYKVGLDSDQKVDDSDPTSTGISSNSVAGPSALVTLPENDGNAENAYLLSPQYDGSDDERVEFNSKSDVSYTGTEFNLRQMSGSNDDLYTGYDVYGAYSKLNRNEKGSYTLNVPTGQAAAGVGFTTTDGSLTPGGGSGSVQAAQPTYQFADGVLTSDGNIAQVKQNENVILVGGPRANSLTQELVTSNQTMPASDYTTGQGIIQLVDGFSEGNKALVVAGATGEDTRAAAEFLANYRNNQQALEGKDKVTVSTQSGTVVSN